MSKIEVCAREARTRAKTKVFLARNLTIYQSLRKFLTFKNKPQPAKASQVKNEAFYLGLWIWPIQSKIRLYGFGPKKTKSTFLSPSPKKSTFPGKIRKIARSAIYTSGKMSPGQDSLPSGAKFASYHKFRRNLPNPSPGSFFLVNFGQKITRKNVPPWDRRPQKPRMKPDHFPPKKKAILTIFGLKKRKMPG